MKALVKRQKGVGHIEVMDVPVPKVSAPTDVLIEIHATGVCGTDLHIYQDAFIYYPPVTLGHEFSGVVLEVGEGVTRFKPGDRVVCEPHSKACGTCEVCRTGYMQLCKSKRSPGWGMDGAFTDYIVMAEHLLHIIPDNVPFDVAALAEPLAIVVHEALERGVVEPKDTVVIVGAGPIGLLAAFATKEAGARRTIVLGIDADEKQRFPAARALGVDHIINVQREDAVKKVMELTGGRGADLIVEASGSEGGINSAAEMVRIRGRISASGLSVGEKVAVPWNKLMLKVVDLRFNFSSSCTAWDRALAIMEASGGKLSALITHRENIENWESVFRDMESGACIKAVMIPERIKPK